MFRFFLLHGLDGQYTFQTKHGTKTQAYQRGVVQSVSAGHSIVVKASNGDVWTWDLTSSTVVRDRSGKVAASSLADGQTVWAGGPVVSGARDAALIVINPPAPPAAH
jgi:ligand-binding sensor domain-containing protein